MSQATKTAGFQRLLAFREEDPEQAVGELNRNWRPFGWDWVAFQTFATRKSSPFFLVGGGFTNIFQTGWNHQPVFNLERETLCFLSFFCFQNVLEKMCIFFGKNCTTEYNYSFDYARLCKLGERKKIIYRWLRRRLLPRFCTHVFCRNFRGS